MMLGTLGHHEGWTGDMTSAGVSPGNQDSGDDQLDTDGDSDDSDGDPEDMMAISTTPTRKVRGLPPTTMTSRAWA
ncbi:hypothetical protein [Natranaeroarchaeum sulfidigenes]|uniref:hypothetical protein n=1 Tax=Natranaeroarchaeum sulfidigenes TaxID=2784880 RepID=UPI001EE5DEB0|nr:hypothetical protein [Natranaeroarchaeum sulfidigenes]